MSGFEQRSEPFGLADIPTAADSWGSFLDVVRVLDQQDRERDQGAVLRGGL